MSGIQTLIVGIGNAWRGDDAAGLWVARRLVARHLPGVAVVELAWPRVELLDLWQGIDVVVLVDAMVSGVSPGMVRRLDAMQEPLTAIQALASTHGFGVATLIELGRVLQRLPAHLRVYGIEAADCSENTTVSPVVLAAIERCTEQIVADLGLVIQAPTQIDG